jgi:hypothetical protein
MAYSAERLYALLPAIYRQRDAERGRPLEALVRVLASQAELVEADIARLYENWFIETCDEWVVPYLGDLLGVRALYPVSAATFSHRARVANTIAYRRRKGTASMLEQLARDTTGWPARAVEFFQYLATTQNVNHPRLDASRTADLTDGARLDVVGTSFDGLSRSVDVRHVDNGRGTHNLMNLGIYLWRLQAYPVDSSVPHRRADGTFAFSALGQDAPLFNHPQTELDMAHLAQEIDLPVPIRRRALKESPDLYANQGNGSGPVEPSLAVFVRKSGEFMAMPIRACDLSQRTRSPASGVVAVDPVLGRFAFAEGETPGPEEIRVSYHYGFSSEIGGGSYERPRPAETGGLLEYRVVDSIADAIARWQADGSPSAVLEIADSGTYRESLHLEVPSGISLVLRAASGRRPIIILSSPWVLDGRSGHGPGGQLALEGLLIAGRQLELGQGAPSVLTFRHCTLVPSGSIASAAESSSADSLLAVGAPAGSSVTLDRTISGRLNIPDASVSISDSIIDGLPRAGIDFSPAIIAGSLRISSSTVRGDVTAYELSEASDTIFDGRVSIERNQTGCVRFCYLGPGSRVPRRFRCQPDEVLRAALGTAQRLRPRFTDTRYGQPGYMQLSGETALEVRTGAEDGAEMGVFHHLLQPQREANLKASLEEYLRVGLEVGLSFVT